ncbi:hypothetical protein [Naumannella halotolerans]|uniref:Uncharacterized protein n=1 Tax=Naumannella halotolerans TaxID=993414 RepID=A0A4R7J1I3_9ACTN|nr:hypothetical protein [Naumannella halotolerans]TDT31012.1 hypothetical protein CLV29_2421 [Naumannella halotolerans]
MPGDGHLSVSRFGGERIRPQTERSPLRSRLAAWPSLLMIIVAAVFGGWLVDLNDRYEGEVRFVDHTYPAGETVPLEDLQIRQIDLAAAENVDGLSSPGALVVILRFRVENHGTGPEGISHINLVDPAGYTFVSENSAPQVAAGFATTFDLAFLVDPDHLQGLQVQLDNSGIYTFADERTEIDLGIDEVRAAQLRESARGLVVESRADEVEGL